MESQHFLEKINVQLNELRTNVAKALQKFGFEPALNSKASSEISSSKAPVSIKSAHNLGTMLIHVADDQLSALSRTIKEPVLTIAPWACARSVIEVCATSTWLLDTGIDTEERMLRIFEFRYAGLKEQIKYWQSRKDIFAEENARKKIKNILQKAKILGITKDDKNKETKLLKEMPKYTQLVNTQLKAESEYRLFSAMLHAHNWALISLGFTRVFDLPNGAFLGKDIKVESIWYLIDTSLKAFQKSIIEKCKLYGWPTEIIETIFISTSRNIVKVFRDINQ